MCGIAGWQLRGGKTFPDAVLSALSDVLRHRGPDDAGTHVDAAHGVALMHRRLSIIDLSAASHQPMVDRSSEVVLLYNGELYNYLELRAELLARGHHFESTGDTEVILRSYLEWGMGCLPRLAGMFALAIWDPRDATLHLARDAMGMKPLYYAELAQGLTFASEVKAFAQLPGFAPEIDPRALQQYLEFGFVFDDHLTLLRGVKKLGPGRRLEVRNGSVASEIVWFEPAAPATHALDEAALIDEALQLFPRVVAEHLIADVPVGILLSGGLDSSLIAALAAKQGPLLTLTMAFDNSSFDERANARNVSNFIGSRHVEVEISSSEIQAEIRKGAWVFDDLFADWGTISTRMLYRRSRELGVKVLLVGEGADELFGGYDTFRLPQRMSLLTQFRLYRSYTGRRHGRLFGDFHAIMRDYLEQGSGDAFHAVRLFESRRQLPNNYVMKVDKASMAESVEARAPFLDYRLAQFAYRLPREWLLRGTENKYLLRALTRRAGLLPATTSGQRKFGAPLPAEWMDNDAGFRDFARGRILDDGRVTASLGLSGAMSAYFDKRQVGYRFPAGISLFRNLAWKLLLLELWAEHYIPARAR